MQAPATSHTISFSSLANQTPSEDYEIKKELLLSLSSRQRYSDAIMLLSSSLPSEKAVHWALKCVKTINQNNMKTPELAAAEKWLFEKSEENRAKILPSRTISQPDAATWLAMATYWIGGDINQTVSDDTTPNVLINDSIYSAIMLSIKAIEKTKQDKAYNDIIAEGIRMLNS